MSFSSVCISRWDTSSSRLKSFDWTIFSHGMFALKVGWFLHFKFSTTLPVVGDCSCSEINENIPRRLLPKWRERKEDILIEKAIPALTKHKTKLATEVFKE